MKSNVRDIASKITLDIKMVHQAFVNQFSTKQLLQLGRILKDEIKKRTREGYGVEKHSQPLKPFPGLSDKTIKKRKNKELSPETQPDKDNLTETGRLLDSLDVRQGDKGVEIYISDEKRQIVVYYQEEADKARPFLYISTNEEEIIDEYIFEIIENILKDDTLEQS